jgi:hypothetical protein
MSKKQDDPVTRELCEAYRTAMEEKIKALRNTIVTSVSISTTIISLLILIMRYIGGK